MTASATLLRDDWEALYRELDRWAADGRVAWFWWRDDDAAEVTPALQRLLALQDEMAIPLTVAVVPQQATAGLADYLNMRPAATAAQHGFAHINHATPDEKKSEFPLSRPWDSCLEDLRQGQAKMRELFPQQTRCILVPPWNRFPAELVSRLAPLAFSVLSGFQLYQQSWAAPGLCRLNTHIDPVDWKRRDSLAGIKTALSAARQCLEAMRSGAAPQQALGLLTHHLRHDEAGWDFIAEFLVRIREHPASSWLDLENCLRIGTVRSNVIPRS